MATQALQRNVFRDDDLRLIKAEDVMFPVDANEATQLDMSVDGCPVRLLDVSPIGARLEHDRQLRADACALRVSGRGTTASIAIRVLRSEVIDRRASHLVYVTFICFADLNQRANEIIASIRQTADDPFDIETFDGPEDAPYVSYRFRDARWQTSCATTPDQPVDGFTLPRGDAEAEVLCRIFEGADAATCNTLRSAIAARLRGCTDFMLV